MDDQLKAAFRREELQVAADIGAKTAELPAKIRALFAELIDPLLSKDEIKQLLGVEDTDENFVRALDSLCRDGTLEVSNVTQRPLDLTEGLELYRKKISENKRLKIVAVESRVGDEIRYQFTFDGRLVRSLAKVDRLDAIAGTGQQREEIRSHVAKIADGINAGINVPNPILITLNQNNCVLDPDPGDELPGSFIVIRGLSEPVEISNPFIQTQPVQVLRNVEVDFPFRPAAFDDEKASLLVDGQQRTAALAMVPVDERPEVMFSVLALVADAEMAKNIFRIANSTQKITTQHSRALLASIEYEGGYLRGEQVKARACKILALDHASSPFKDLVRYPGVPRTPKQVLVYNSLFQVVSKIADNSGLPIETDAEELAEVVEKCFTIIKDTWPEAWGEKPGDTSRLMHGAGLRSLAGLCADLLLAVYRQYSSMSDKAWEDLESSLRRLRTTILWNDSALTGNKEQAKNYRDKIHGVQNTSQSIADLTTFLVRASLELDRRAKAKS